MIHSILSTLSGFCVSTGPIAEALQDKSHEVGIIQKKGENVQKMPLFSFFIQCLVLHIVLLGCIVTSACATDMPAESNAHLFDSLRIRLAADGFDVQQIKALYSDKQTRFDTKGVSLFLVHSEASLNYDQFATRKSIHKARKYMRTHRSALRRAEKDFGVEGAVITSIILVETRLGSYTGSRSILNTLSTMAALSDAKVRKYLWRHVGKKSKLKHLEYQKWCDRKSGWAYKELKAFLTYTAREKFDPLDIRGSYAGALGIAQFMPTNVIAYAKDGNADGRVDLFDHADAIASIANYLKRYGWKPGLTGKKAYKVIHRYNHSNYYVDIILKIAKKLKG